MTTVLDKLPEVICFGQPTVWNNVWFIMTNSKGAYQTLWACTVWTWWMNCLMEAFRDMSSVQSSQVLIHCVLTAHQHTHKHTQEYFKTWGAITPIWTSSSSCISPLHCRWFHKAAGHSLSLRADSPGIQYIEWWSPVQTSSLVYSTKQQFYVTKTALEWNNPSIRCLVIMLIVLNPK